MTACIVASMTPFSRERMANLTGQIGQTRDYSSVLLSSPHWIHRLVNALHSLCISGLSALSKQTCSFKPTDNSHFISFEASDTLSTESVKLPMC